MAKRLDIKLQQHHRLSDVDKNSRTAVCLICGPVDIRFISRGRVACGNARREQESKKQYRKIAGDIPSLEIPCEICGEPSQARDHCHETNKWRGSLCTLCNLGLGAFRDRTDLLESAAAYLNKKRAML